jgi:protein-L-isoaspartate O-methyltransferase
MANDEAAARDKWIAALQERYLENLRVPEVTRALRALSSTYVERRTHGSRPHVRGALDTAGKRAAFAAYYAPLHFVAVTAVVRALGADRPVPRAILDIGCGTGVAGAAWALAAGGAPEVTGIDRHPWAVAEARWTYAQLGVRGHARQGDVGRLQPDRAPTSLIAAYLLNELPDEARTRTEAALLAAADRGSRVLVIEPVARGITPWWTDTAARVLARGGRVDEWRLPIEPPAPVQLFGRAAGLNYRELRVQSLFL